MDQPFDQRHAVLSMAARIAPEVRVALEETIAGVEVLGGIAALDGEIARCMALCAGGFLLLEVSRSGERLCVALPTWRIKRVVETRTNGLTRVQVELDADRVVHVPQSDGTSTAVAAIYDVAQPVDADTEVRAFAAVLRTALLTS